MRTLLLHPLLLTFLVFSSLARTIPPPSIEHPWQAAKIISAFSEDTRTRIDDCHRVSLQRKDICYRAIFTAYTKVHKPPQGRAPRPGLIQPPQPIDPDIANLLSRINRGVKQHSMFSHMTFYKRHIPETPHEEYMQAATTGDIFTRGLVNVYSILQHFRDGISDPEQWYYTLKREVRNLILKLLTSILLHSYLDDAHTEAYWKSAANIQSAKLLKEWIEHRKATIITWAAS